MTIELFIPSDCSWWLEQIGSYFTKGISVLLKITLQGQRENLGVQKYT